MTIHIYIYIYTSFTLQLGHLILSCQDTPSSQVLSARKGISLPGHVEPLSPPAGSIFLGTRMTQRGLFSHWHGEKNPARFYMFHSL